MAVFADGGGGGAKVNFMNRKKGRFFYLISFALSCPPNPKLAKYLAKGIIKNYFNSFRVSFELRQKNIFITGKNLYIGLYTNCI
jgi:hypothetical protein